MCLWFHKISGVYADGDFLEPKQRTVSTENRIFLPPKPSLSGSLSKAMFGVPCGEPKLSAEDVANTLFAISGVTGKLEYYGFDYYFHSYPSAGALYPVEVYVAIIDSEIPAGIYRFNSLDSSIELIKRGNFKDEISETICSEFEGNCVFMLSVDYRRSASKYGYRGYRYSLLDAGHAALNGYLYLCSRDIPSLMVGKFVDSLACNLFSLPCFYEFPVLFIVPGLSKAEGAFESVSVELDIGGNPIVDAYWSGQISGCFFERDEKLLFSLEQEHEDLKDSLLDVIIRRRSSRRRSLSIDCERIVSLFTSFTSRELPTDWENGVDTEILGDDFQQLSSLCLEQEFIAEAMLSFIFMTEINNNCRDYRLKHLEAGMLSESVYLLSTALGCSVCAVGAFEDEALKGFLSSSDNIYPLLLDVVL